MDHSEGTQRVWMRNADGAAQAMWDGGATQNAGNALRFASESNEIWQVAVYVERTGDICTHSLARPGLSRWVSAFLPLRNAETVI